MRIPLITLLLLPVLSLADDRKPDPEAEWSRTQRELTGALDAKIGDLANLALKLDAAPRKSVEEIAESLFRSVEEVHQVLNRAQIERRKSRAQQEALLREVAARDAKLDDASADKAALTKEFRELAAELLDYRKQNAVLKAQAENEASKVLQAQRTIDKQQAQIEELRKRLKEK